MDDRARASLAFTASRGGFSPSTLSVLEYDALSKAHATLPLALGCAKEHTKGTAPRYFAAPGAAPLLSVSVEGDAPTYAVFEPLRPQLDAPFYRAATSALIPRAEYLPLRAWHVEGKPEHRVRHYDMRSHSQPVQRVGEPGGVWGAA